MSSNPGVNKYGTFAFLRAHLNTARPKNVNTPPTSRPNFRSSRGPVLSSLMSFKIMSIQFEFFEPVDVLVERLLVRLFEQEIPHHQIVHVRAHKAQVGLLRRADDWFAPHVEGGVDDHRAAALVRKLLDRPVKDRVVLLR